MDRRLQAGDHVRITSANRRPDYQIGDEGTVLWGPILHDDRQSYYIVAMGRGHPALTSTIFLADEIEPAD